MTGNFRPKHFYEKMLSGACEENFFPRRGALQPHAPSQSTAARMCYRAPAKEKKCRVLVINSWVWSDPLPKRGKKKDIGVSRLSNEIRDLGQS